ncbi:MAG: FtsW/RodA/SpoVE family cell cycle protein [Armatimonadetes bacterium]|nr:FtsW/RodA/SpoVE family cell cycle protein [Armatimonadota bacterium]
MGRPRERWLLVHVAILLAAFDLGLAAQRMLSGQALWAGRDAALLGGYLAALWLLHRALVAMGVRGDEAIVPLVGLLSGLGVLVRLRLGGTAPGWPPGSWWLVRAGSLAVLAGAVWVCRRRILWLDAAAWLCGLAAPVLVYVLIRHGTAYRGAMFGPGLTTPTELLKPLLVIFLAGFLKQRRYAVETAVFLGIWAATLVLLKKQHDYGMIAILAALLLSMCFVASGRTRYLLAGLATASLLVTALSYAEPLGLHAGVAERRISAWLDPWTDPMNSGYQTVQGLFALRAGGIDGTGLGRGSPRLVPLVESDFVYAGLAEELGLLGTGLLLVLYVALFRRGYRIAALATHPFRQRLATGCMTVLAIQTAINVAGVVRASPITGITLPFVSHGGSSLLVCHGLIGLVLAVGHDVEEGEGEGEPAEAESW